MGLLSTVTGTQTAQTGTDIADRSIQGAARPERAMEAPAAASPDAPALDTVSLSASAEINTSNTAPTPVYAEIWKGSIKLAQVDIHGHVTSFTGAPTPEGGTGGGVLAAQRAVQLAQQTGGEVRVAGTPLNGQTLLTRARLESAYAI